MRRDEVELARLEGLIARQVGTRPQQAAETRADHLFRSQASRILALPSLPLDPIQDTDPASPTFGQFLWSLDFTPLT